MDNIDDNNTANTSILDSTVEDGEKIDDQNFTEQNVSSETQGKLSSIPTSKIANDGGVSKKMDENPVSIEKFLKDVHNGVKKLTPETEILLKKIEELERSNNNNNQGKKNVEGGIDGDDNMKDDENVNNEKNDGERELVERLARAVDSKFLAFGKELEGLKNRQVMPPTSSSTQTVLSSQKNQQQQHEIPPTSTQTYVTYSSKDSAKIEKLKKKSDKKKEKIKLLEKQLSSLKNEKKNQIGSIVENKKIMNSRKRQLVKHDDDDEYRTLLSAVLGGNNPKNIGPNQYEQKRGEGGDDENPKIIKNTITSSNSISNFNKRLKEETLENVPISKRYDFLTNKNPLCRYMIEKLDRKVTSSYGYEKENKNRLSVINNMSEKEKQESIAQLFAGELRNVPFNTQIKAEIRI